MLPPTYCDICFHYSSLHNLLCCKQICEQDAPLCLLRWKSKNNIMNHEHRNAVLLTAVCHYDHSALTILRSVIGACLCMLTTLAHMV